MRILIVGIGIAALLCFIIILAFDVNRHLHPAKKLLQSNQTTQMRGTAIRYLPLGDSYTIGQSVPAADRWPNQLVAKFQAVGTNLSIVANPAVTGYTSEDLITNELPLLKKTQPDFVTIQIGVNDFVQGVPIQKFQTNLDYIVQKVKQGLSDKQNLLLVTIPDFSKTPTGAQFGPPAELQAGVEAYNAAITAVGSRDNVPVADIFTVSQQVADDPELIASDGLHPSGSEYTAWTNVIFKTLMAAKLPIK